MDFLHTARLVLTPLSPIHVGCGEDFDPTNYLIEGQTLFGFDPGCARLPEKEAGQLGQLGDRADLLGIQRFFREQREHFLPHAQVLIPVAAGVAAEYEQSIGRVANREANGNWVFNRLFIERASHTNGQPYIPGSSLKGALRTAIVDRLNGGKFPLPDERGFRGNTWDSTKIEARLLKGDFATSPLRLVKPADLMPAGEVARQIVYAVNQMKELVRDREGNEKQARGPTNRKECISPGQYRAFAGSVTVHDLGAHGDQKTTPENGLRPRSLASIARDVHGYHEKRLHKELQILDERGFVDPDWKRFIEHLLAGELCARLAAGRAFLVRLGRYGGAESKTLSGEGVAQIKILQGKGPDGRQRQPLVQGESKTVWLAAQHKDDRKHLLPFGWALVEIDPQQDLVDLRAWCHRQVSTRPDMQAIRARFAEARAAAEQRAATQRAAKEAARAAEEARQGEEAERERRKASLSPAMQRIEGFVDDCRKRADQLRGGKDKPHTAYHGKAKELAEEAAGWAPADREAVAQAIEEWLPRVVSIEAKTLRKAPWFAALRAAAQG
ncbi:RAMP superfamily CRISPR-associated protein [Accumulibacter sp.]|uniref:RAMP superfamily CRISPR-associated protein n=1 Tax=Accumulibacter sp. TaxID=2053492 RepID=UPI0025F213D1|nr:RAMP superfamily CRISPR-associated protein [Accumulibacter sp.]MCM8626798.1 RAMP superfamily CRISPR-associated protein [Accumulibacter sp.]